MFADDNVKFKRVSVRFGVTSQSEVVMVAVGLQPTEYEVRHRHVAERRLKRDTSQASLRDAATGFTRPWTEVHGYPHLVALRPPKSGYAFQKAFHNPVPIERIANALIRMPKLCILPP